MKSVVYLRNLRIAPRKIRLSADLVRGKKALEARDILNVAIKRGAKPILKLLNSAIAAAKQNFQADEANLYIAKLLVDEGQKLKRFRPRARGQAYEIQKKTSHITLELNEMVEGKRSSRAPVGERKEISKEKMGIQEKKKFEIEKEEREKPKAVRAMQRIFRRKAI